MCVIFGVVAILLQVGVEAEGVYLWLLWGLSQTSVVGVRGQRLDLLWLLCKAFCFLSSHGGLITLNLKWWRLKLCKDTCMLWNTDTQRTRERWTMNGWSCLFKVYLRWKWACATVTIHREYLCNTDLYSVVAQVVFLPGFGCLYIDVEYDKGTLVLSLAPEGSMDAVINQHSRYVCTGSGFIVVLCSLHIWTIWNHLCMLFILTSRYLPVCLLLCSLQMSIWLLLTALFSCSSCY